MRGLDQSINAAVWAGAVPQHFAAVFSAFAPVVSWGFNVAGGAVVVAEAGACPPRLRAQLFTADFAPRADLVAEV